MEEGELTEANHSTNSLPIQFRRTYDWSATNPSLAAINALATVKNVDPLDLTPKSETKLYDYIDPDALDMIVGTGKTGPISVSFTFGDAQIQFSGDELLVRSTDR